MKERIDFLNEQVKGKDLDESLRIAASEFDDLRFSSALGQEDQVITDAIFRKPINIEVFTLDTGRLFPETYDLLERTQSRYKQALKVYFPEATKVEDYVNEKGINGFYQSVTNRKECCFIRKVLPLQRALDGAEVWVTGLRAEQSDNRQGLSHFEWDEVNGLIKFNPLIDWSFEEVLAYLKWYKVPYNALHDKGFKSIGCAPCTRAIEKGEHARAGRWWWETSAKECGLHQVKAQDKVSA